MVKQVFLFLIYPISLHRAGLSLICLVSLTSYMQLLCCEEHVCFESEVIQVNRFIASHPLYPCFAQDFVVRNDMQCGSTIGPILASGIGIRTVDVGAPQLSMHSIREMCGVDDVGYSYNHFKAFFEEFSALDAQLTVDEP